MTNSEILNYIWEGTKWMGIGTAGYFSTLFILQALSAISPFNEKIKSKEQLERVVVEEAGKLGLDSSNIDVKYVDKGGSCADNKEGGYVVAIESGINCTRNSVKHELCHVKNGDCDREKEKDLYYYFVGEPRAVLYEVFGIKL